MNKRKVTIGGVVILLVFAAAWAFGFFDRSDPAIAELQQIGSQAFDRNLPDAQRDQLRQEFRQKMDGLSDDQRRAFFDANRGQWEERAQQRMEKYFKLTKSEQQKRLDEILDRIVKGRNSQQQRQQQQANAGQGNQNNRGGDANRGGRRNMTETQREDRSKSRLDRSTPKMRAQMVEFRKQLEGRAQQRGINLGDPGRGGGWGFRGA
jgi:hypothetical protein